MGPLIRLVLVCLALAASPAGAQEASVDLEIVFAVDASGSVDDEEFGLQVGGIAGRVDDHELGRRHGERELGCCAELAGSEVDGRGRGEDRLAGRDRDGECLGAAAGVGDPGRAEERLTFAVAARVGGAVAE